jgi:hypothetical protein
MQKQKAQPAPALILTVERHEKYKMVIAPKTKSSRSGWRYISNHPTEVEGKIYSFYRVYQSISQVSFQNEQVILYLAQEFFECRAFHNTSKYYTYPLMAYTYPLMARTALRATHTTRALSL